MNESKIWVNVECKKIFKSVFLMNLENQLFQENEKLEPWIGEHYSVGLNSVSIIRVAWISNSKISS